MKPIKYDYKIVMRHIAYPGNGGIPICLGFVYDLESLDQKILTSTNSDLLDIFRSDFENGHQISWYNWETDIFRSDFENGHQISWYNWETDIF